MLISFEQRNELNQLFEKLRLTQKQGKKSGAKINQILSYLEVLASNCRKLSRKRALVLVDSCCGNCYLSFLAYYYFTFVEKRGVEVHCVDHNSRLMDKCEGLAADLGFDNIYFHRCRIDEYTTGERVDIVYSLHACDTATDATLYFGIKHNVKTVLSVSCCQFSIRKKFRNSQYRGITRHSVFKEKLVYMVGDSLRALLLEMNGYKADIFEFTSSRYTDKNTMLRAQKNSNVINNQLLEDYCKISREFRVKPKLESFLNADFEE